MSKKESKEQPKKGNYGLIIGLITGLSLGLIAGWLFGPPEFLRSKQKRDAVKQKISEQTHKAKHKTADFFDNVSDKLREDESKQLSHQLEGRSDTTVKD